MVSLYSTIKMTHSPINIRFRSLNKYMCISWCINQMLVTNVAERESGMKKRNVKMGGECICLIQFNVQGMLRSATGWEKKENHFLRQSVDVNVRNLLQLNFFVLT